MGWFLLVTYRGIDMARVTPQEFADKWRRRISGATEDIRRGIDRVQTAPGQSAAEAQEAMQTNLNEAINSGRWARNVSNVTLDQWKTAARDKGVARVAPGAQAAESKMTRIAQDLLPAVDAAAAEAKRIPKVTIDDSIQRAAVFMRRMREFRDRS